MCGLRCCANNLSNISCLSSQRCHLLCLWNILPFLLVAQQSKSDHSALNFLKPMLMNYQCHPQLLVALWVQNTAHTTSSSQWESGEKRLSSQGTHCAFSPEFSQALGEASSPASQGKAWLWLFDFSELRVPGWSCCRFPGSWHSETLSSKTEMPGRERAMLIWWQRSEIAPGAQLGYLALTLTPFPLSFSSWHPTARHRDPKSWRAGLTLWRPNVTLALTFMKKQTNHCLVLEEPSTRGYLEAHFSFLIIS